MSAIHDDPGRAGPGRAGSFCRAPVVNLQTRPHTTDPYPLKSLTLTLTLTIPVAGRIASDENNLVGHGGSDSMAIQITRGPHGFRLDVSATIDADAEDVWEVFVDVRQWPDWGPTVTAVKCQRRRVRAGTTGQICALGMWLPFEITSYSPSDPQRWRWSVRGISATGHRVERLHDSRCRAVFEIPLYAAWYAPVCRVALRRIARLAGSE